MKENNMNSGFMVYWVDPKGYPSSKLFNMSELTQCLNYMEELRKDSRNQFVGMVSQNPDSVGKPGVSDKLPDDYSWSKQHRGDGQLDGPKTIIGGRSNG